MLHPGVQGQAGEELRAAPRSRAPAGAGWSPQSEAAGEGTVQPGKFRLVSRGRGTPWQPEPGPRTCVCAELRLSARGGGGHRRPFPGRVRRPRSGRKLTPAGSSRGSGRRASPCPRSSTLGISPSNYKPDSMTPAVRLTDLSPPQG